MKRINQETNQIFKRGDLRHDGYVFYKYMPRIRKDGTNAELWLSPVAYEKHKMTSRVRRMEKYVRTSTNLPKGWNRKLWDKKLIAHCKELWVHMRQTPLTMEELRKACWSDQVFELLKPHAQPHGN